MLAGAAAAAPCHGGARRRSSSRTPATCTRARSRRRRTRQLAAAPRRDARASCCSGPRTASLLDGLALPTVDAFRTPLGDVPIDADAARRRGSRLRRSSSTTAPTPTSTASRCSCRSCSAVLDEFASCRSSSAARAQATVAAVLDAVWGGPETLIVVSSDLSHYEDSRLGGRATIARTADAIVARRAGRHRPARRVRRVPAARAARGGRVRATSSRCCSTCASSGDTAGPRDRVVGYGAFALATTGATDMSVLVRDRSRRDRDRARATGVRRRPPLAGLAPRARRAGRVVRDARTRRRACSDASARSKRANRSRSTSPSTRSRAAFDDPRLPAVIVDDFPEMSVKVSVLSPSVPVAAALVRRAAACVRPGVDGLTVESGSHRATLLPSVWPKVAIPTSSSTRCGARPGCGPVRGPGRSRSSRYTHGRGVRSRTTAGARAANVSRP